MAHLWGGARYAEALYWRAAFAARSADAERDYRRLSVEFPLSGRAADALIALAQLEYVRGDTTLAVHHLQRLMIEHPAGVRSARKHIGWAVHALPGGDAFRRIMNTIDNAEAQFVAVRGFFEALAEAHPTLPAANDAAVALRA